MSDPKHLLMRGKGRPPKWRAQFVEIPGEEPEARATRLFAAERAALAPRRSRPEGRPRIHPEGFDPLSVRPGAIKGRCNAMRQKHPGKLCKARPMSNGRCAYHGGRGLRGGWHNGRRAGLDGIPYFAPNKGNSQ